MAMPRIPFSQVDALRSEMDRLLEDFLTSPARTLSRVVSRRPAFPAVNIWDGGTVIFVEAELPGLQIADLDLTIAGNQLTLAGARTTVDDKEAVIHRQERGNGQFARIVELPCAVDAENVRARLCDGVLTVELSKAEAAKARKIPVQGGEDK